MLDDASDMMGIAVGMPERFAQQEAAL